MPQAQSDSCPLDGQAIIQEATKSGRDPRVGKEAAIFAGHMKGWRGNLVAINREFATLECLGRQPPFFEAALKNVVLL